MRDWRVSRRFLLRRSVAWYSNSLRRPKKFHAEAADGRGSGRGEGELRSNRGRTGGGAEGVPRVDARGAAGGEVGSLAERATAAAAAAAGPPRRHHLAAIRRAAVANSWLPGARWRRRRGRGRGKPFACVGKGMRGGEERES